MINKEGYLSPPSAVGGDGSGKSSQVFFSFFLGSSASQSIWQQPPLNSIVFSFQQSVGVNSSSVLQVAGSVWEDEQCCVGWAVCGLQHETPSVNRHVRTWHARNLKSLNVNLLGTNQSCSKASKKTHCNSVVCLFLPLYLFISFLIDCCFARVSTEAAAPQRWWWRSFDSGSLWMESGRSCESSAYQLFILHQLFSYIGSSSLHRTCIYIFMSRDSPAAMERRPSLPWPWAVEVHG